ncbi:MAG: hypothetical protein GKR93_17045 [Gammaproteobacteria bacterium]|nr:hypothetical protein [Gammaproteobacteria bacterium]
MNYQPSLLLLIMILCSTPTKAENQRDDIFPSPDFLEFLGKWETNNGDWVDPENFEDEDFVNLMNITDTESNRVATPGVLNSHPLENRSETEND